MPRELFIETCLVPHLQLGALLQKMYPQAEEGHNGTRNPEHEGAKGTDRSPEQFQFPEKSAQPFFEPDR